MLNEKFFKIAFLSLVLISQTFFIFAQSPSITPQSVYSSDGICFIYENYNQLSIPYEIRPTVSSVGCSCVPIWSTKNFDSEVSIEYARSDFGEISDTLAGDRRRFSDNYCRTLSSPIGDKVSGALWGNYPDPYWPGTVFECINDVDTAEPEEENPECAPSTPYCNDHGLCSECYSAQQCVMQYPNAFNYECKIAKYYRPKQSVCTSCLSLRGGEEGTVITFAGSIPLQSAKYIVDSLVEIQPFKYLDETNKIRFQFAQVKFDNFIIPFLYKSPINSRVYLDIKTQREMVSLVRETCPDTNDPVIHNYLIKTAYHSPQANAVFIGAAFDSDIRVLAHELGHQLGGLADEYSLPYESRWYPGSIQNTGPNVDNSDCNKFENVDELNCWTIWGLRNDLSFPVPENLFKSTQNSIMANHRGSSFNIISCQALLEKVGELDENTALNLCKKWACEGDIIKQSETVC
ncbi:MAG TPA: hypothetical protein P5277_04245 [Candidatus Paceibacterota bacterium]|nr:hypothetical protein [Candidatus Paceibacterota bacterium]